MSELVCYCLRVEKNRIVGAIESGCSNLADLASALRVGTGCGGCIPDLENLLRFYGPKGQSTETPKFVPYP